MTITYYGLGAFKITIKNNSEEASVFLNPLNEKTGLKGSKNEANITLFNNPSAQFNLNIKKNDPTFLIDCAGEYEVKNIGIKGVNTNGEKENIIYRLDAEGITLVHLGELNRALAVEELEELGAVDILIVPVGNSIYANAEKAWEIINQIEPRLIIPAYYKIEGLNSELEDANKFISLSGLTPRFEDKLKISAKDLPAEDRELVILNPVLN